MKRAILILLVSSVAYAQPSSPSGKPTTPAAQARFDAGFKAYTAGDFKTASKEFAAGFAAEPWSGFLFAWAQSERKRGECVEAVKLYERFLATNPPPKAKQLAEDGIAVCKAGTTITVVDDRPTVVEEPPVVEEKPIIEKPPVEQREERPFRHKLAVGLGAGAAVMAGIGIYCYVSSSNLADDANRQPTHPQASDLYDRAKTRRILAHVSTGASVALAAAAVVRFVTNRDDDDNGLAITPSGVSYVARF